MPTKITFWQTHVCTWKNKSFYCYSNKKISKINWFIAVSSHQIWSYLSDSIDCFILCLDLSL